MATVQKIDISSSTIYRTILIGVAFWFLFVIRDILLIVFAAVVIASAIDPVAHFLKKKRVPRGVTVSVVYLLLVGIVVAAFALVIPPLSEQISQLAQTLPQLAASISAHFGLQSSATQDQIIAQLQNLLQTAGDNAAIFSVSVFERTRSLLDAIISLIVVFMIAFYLSLEERALHRVFQLFVPREHMAYVDRIIERTQHKIGRWVLGQIALMAVMGIVIGVGLTLMGLKYALSLAIVAAIMEVIPVIGPIITAIPAILLGLTVSPLTAGIVLIFYVLAHQLENHVLVPNIMGKAIGLNPLITLLAVLLGARLFGIPGIILAVPFAAIVSDFASDFFTTSEPTEDLPG